jgi:cytochrome c556
MIQKIKIIKTIIIIFSLSFTFSAYAETVEEIIKGRKALFSKNYSFAKRVQALSSKGDFEKAKKLMLKMSENYKTLINYFPDNSKEGFKTEALPIIWENKDEFNALMNKSSNDMIKLTSLIEDTESVDEVRAVLTKMMWGNCKACHSRFRAPH